MIFIDVIREYLAGSGGTGQKNPLAIQTKSHVSFLIIRLYMNSLYTDVKQYVHFFCKKRKNHQFYSRRHLSGGD